jgi:hypothetical protein
MLPYSFDVRASELAQQSSNDGQPPPVTWDTEKELLFLLNGKQASPLIQRRLTKQFEQQLAPTSRWAINP